VIDSLLRRRLFAILCAVVMAGAGQADSLAATNRGEGQQLYRDHPDWLLPAWTGDGPAAWTMVGAPYGESVTLIGADGSFAPRNHGPSVSLWLYDRDAGRLLAPGPRAFRFRLDDDGAPIVSGVWDIDDLRVETTFFTGLPGASELPWFERPGAGLDQAATFIRVQVATSSGTERRLAAYLALRPVGIEPAVHAIGSATCDAERSTLVADGDLVLVGLQPAEACGVTSFGLGGSAAPAARDRVPGQTILEDEAGRAEAVLRVALTPGPKRAAQVEFRAPLGHGSQAALTSGGFDDERARVQAAWRPVLARVNLDVPDQRVDAAFRASQMYLLLNRGARLPRSGPLAHDAFWVRDAAYIGEALERIGAGRDNETTLEALLATQRDDGSVPAITDRAGPRSVDEWDAPGQAIASVVSHYRFSRDRRWLERTYPALLRAAQFIDALRGRTLDQDPETRSLLPANMSAEDLGSATWHHYWDDFWAIAGYREAAYAASELGRTADAADLGSKAGDLQASLLRSIDLVRARTNRDFVPNGPQDVVSSAMARGTTPALWPVRSLRGVAADDLLMRSFNNYYTGWLAGQGGGYRHYEDTLWPYGGLGIAHAMLRLGLRAEAQQVLHWTLEHQTLPGTYAWGEAINPRHGGLELGDMPHSWAAAEMIGLVRGMLLDEDEGWLVVNAGAPDAWFEPGKTVALRGAPTHYGLASVELTRLASIRGAEADLRVTLDGSPLLGWRVRLPGEPRQVRIDDGPPSNVGDGEVRLTPGAHRILVSYAF
jgi:hypothetical protein